MIIKEIFWSVAFLYFLISMPVMLVYHIVNFCFQWKCRKKRYEKFWFNKCYEKECKWARFCDNYEQPLTAEDIAQLYKMIEDYQKKAIEKA